MSDTDPAPASTETDSDSRFQALVDEWGEDSFPASDPPGRLPPSLQETQEHQDGSARQSNVN